MFVKHYFEVKKKMTGLLEKLREEREYQRRMGLEIVTQCLYDDAIKFGEKYVNLPKEAVKEIITEAKKYGYAISHGCCESCLEKQIKQYGMVE